MKLNIVKSKNNPNAPGKDGLGILHATYIYFYQHFYIHSCEHVYSLQFCLIRPEATIEKA